MTTSAKVLLDSISMNGDRLTTFEVVMHRFVLAEFNTNRVFSRNSASSRAIPVDKQLARLIEDPAWPLVWASEQPGMQGGLELGPGPIDEAMELFGNIHAGVCQAIGDYLRDHPDKSTRLHKSLINRLMEPFMWHTVIVSSTEWQNFFDQRASEFSPLAQPEMQAAADAMLEAFRASTPNLVGFGEWHTPLIQPDEDFEYPSRQKISAARCARVSYLTHEGLRDPSKDVDMFDNTLMGHTPRHASPLEHVATPAPFWGEPEGNFTGWYQLRHMMNYETGEICE